MRKYFVIAFILFLAIYSYIIFSDEENDKIIDNNKHIEAINTKEIRTKNIMILDEHKIKDDRKKVIMEIETKIKDKSSNIQNIINQADKLIKDNNLILINSNKLPNEKMDKVNKKYQELKKEIDNLN